MTNNKMKIYSLKLQIKSLEEDINKKKIILFNLKEDLNNNLRKMEKLNKKQKIWLMSISMLLEFIYGMIVGLALSFLI